MKKYSLFVISFLIFYNCVFSQSDTLKTNETHFQINVKATENKDYKTNPIISNNIIAELLSNSDLRITSGVTQFYGDIKEFDYLPAYDESSNFLELKSAVEISLTKQVNPLISIQGSFIMGQFGGLNREKVGSDYQVYEPYAGFYEGNGEYFITNFKELDASILINVSNATSFFKKLRNNNYTSYLKFGIGFNAFNSLNRNLGTGNYIYSWGYEEGIFQQNDGFIKESLSDSPKETVYLFGFTSQYKINKTTSIVFDITKRKAYTDFWDSHNNNAKDDNFNFYSIGICYKMGKHRQSKEWRTPLEGIEQSLDRSHAKIEWLSEDQDHDGVSDAFDKEPNTPMGVAVDGSGVSLDVDMDNVPDYLDADPFSTRGAIVDENGVEFDSDNDGVPDSKDLESNTKIGSIVNQYGITMSGNIESKSNTSYFASIYFETASYYINNSNLKRIATIAKILQENPKINLKVIGHADKTGSEEFNEKLSLKRAEEVINYLYLNFGIQRERLFAISYGETKPLINIIEGINEEIHNNHQYLEINRRVDFEIIK